MWYGSYYKNAEYSIKESIKIENALNSMQLDVPRLSCIVPSVMERAALN